MINQILCKNKIGKYIKGDTKAILAAKSQGYSKSGDYDFEFNGKIYKPVDSKGIRNRWLWTKDRMEAAAKLGILIETSNTLRCQLYIDKKFDEKTNTMTKKNEKMIFHTSDFMTNNEYTNSVGDTSLENIMGAKCFNNPKPIRLIQDLILLATTQSNMHFMGDDSPHSLDSGESDIILDFFAGSGTTAHAVMELNAQDNGNRQFILVQLDERIDSAKSKVAYDFCKNELGSENPTIFDITKERIKRAGAKIAQSKTHPLTPSAREGEQEYAKSLQEGESLDLGFKVYEIRHNDLQSNDDSLFDSINLSDDDKNALLESFKLQDSLPLSVQNHKVDLGGYEGILAGEKFYLLNPHFETKHLQNLIEKIDTQKDFVIKEISYLNNVFDSARIREIEEGITTYANKKGLKILVRARFI